MAPRLPLHLAQPARGPPMQLRDGRKLLGKLRAFDQFANLVLEGARERVIVGSQAR